MRARSTFSAAFIRSPERTQPCRRSFDKSSSSWKRKTRKKSIRIKVAHLIFGNILSAILVTVTAVLILINVINRRLNIAEATVDFLIINGALTCFSSVLFWRTSRPQLGLIFSHLANAAEQLEDLNEATKSRVEKEMTRLRFISKLPFIGMWLFLITMVLGAGLGHYVIRFWLLDSVPHWLRTFYEFCFHFQAAGSNVPATCSIVVLFLLTSGALFACLNSELTRCDGDEEYLTKLIQIHRELLIASIFARHLFKNQLLSYGLVWITVLLISASSIASHCFDLLAINGVFLGVSIIVCSCETGDVLVKMSLATADAVSSSGWEKGDGRFRQKMLIMLMRAQRPACLAIRFSGLLHRPQLTILKKVYSIFTLMLTMYDGDSCGA